MGVAEFQGLALLVLREDVVHIVQELIETAREAVELLAGFLGFVDLPLSSLGSLELLQFDSLLFTASLIDGLELEVELLGSGRVVCVFVILLVHEATDVVVILCQDLGLFLRGDFDIELLAFPEDTVGFAVSGFLVEFNDGACRLLGILIHTVGHEVPHFQDFFTIVVILHFSKINFKRTLFFI